MALQLRPIRVRKGHPHTRDRYRSLLARRSLLELLIAFVAVLVGLGFVLAFPFWLGDGEGGKHTFWFWWRQATLLLSGFATSTSQDDLEGVRAAAQLAGALGGLVFPALVLGTVVFKAFVQNQIYVKRDKLAVVPAGKIVGLDEEGVDYWLAFRIYSATKLQLVDVQPRRYWLITISAAATRPRFFASPKYPETESPPPFTCENAATKPPALTMP